jgi:uncharacterized cofD-like protein
MVALSDESDVIRGLLTRRIEEGPGKGHTLGNFIFSELEKNVGRENVIAELSEWWKVRGSVIPVTFEDVTLKARTATGKVLTGEHEIDKIMHDDRIVEVFYDQHPTANPQAVQAIKNSDLVVISPGDMFTSNFPSIIIPEITTILRLTKADVALVTPLMNKFGHTDDFTVQDYFYQYERVLGEGKIDFVIYNTLTPDSDLLERYKKEGGLVDLGEEDISIQTAVFVGRELISQQPVVQSQADTVQRSLIRHNSGRIASLLYEMVHTDFAS